MLAKQIKKNLVFDFDGVIANTNHVKTNAFERVLGKFDLPHSKLLIAYHKLYGGVTALAKFEHYCSFIYPSCKISPARLENRFRQIVATDLMDQQFDTYIKNFEKMIDRYQFHIISGGNQCEIERYLKLHSLNKIFNGCILGNPTPKDVNYELYSRKFRTDESIYFGDSVLDAELSAKYNVDFVFISHWSEVPKDKVLLNNYRSYVNLKSAFEALQL